MSSLGFDPSRLGPAAGSRVAVIGGCGGMGRVLVQALLDTGVEVAVLDLPRSLAEHSPPPQALALEIDGSQAESVKRAFGALGRRWPQLHGMVNLAGFFKGYERLQNLPVEVFDEVIAGNLRSHFLCAQAALPLLHAAEAMGFDVAACVYVGDDERDILAARAAGMRSLVALWGYRLQHDDPLAWEADAMVETPADLLDPDAWP